MLNEAQSCKDSFIYQEMSKMFKRGSLRVWKQNFGSKDKFVSFYNGTAFFTSSVAQKPCSEVEAEFFNKYADTEPISAVTKYTGLPVTFVLSTKPLIYRKIEKFYPYFSSYTTQILLKSRLLTILKKFSKGYEEVGDHKLAAVLNELISYWQETVENARNFYNKIFPQIQFDLVSECIAENAVN